MHLRPNPSLSRTAFSLLLTTALCASAANAAPVVSWRFDAAHQEGGNFKALAGPNIPAGDIQLVSDTQGQAIALNRQSILIADNFTKVPALMPTQNMTVSMWVSVDAGRKWGGLLGAMQDNGDFERGWILGYENDKFSFAVATQGKGRMTYLLSKTSYVPGQWYHIAGTYDGKTMSLYVNGVLESQSAEQSGPIIYPTEAPFILGAHKDDNAYFPMKGRIREAQLELDALPAQQIATQFQAQAALVQLAPAPLAPPPPPPAPAGPIAVPGNRKVLIIGTDGTRPDKLEATNIPNIRALMTSGAYDDKAQTGLPTVSGPGWSSALTGVWHEKHLVTGNNFKGNNYAQYPDVLTRLEKINPAFSTFAAADWPPLLTGDSNGPLVSDEIDTKIALHGHTEENDRRVAALASDYLAHENVDAAFVYFGEVDGQGHAVGPLNPLYTKAIEHVDGYVGQLVSAIKSRPNYANEDWLILMTTDHGHVDKGGHGGPSPVERTIFFLANGPDVDAKNFQEPVGIVDVGVTALAHLGIKADPTWGLDGKVQALKAP